MILTDVHTHTTFSPDGADDIFSMVAEAERKKIAYYGIAEHVDYDYKVNKFLFDGKEPEYTDLDEYFSVARELQKRERGRIQLLVGLELGFTPNRAVIPLYNEIKGRYNPDFIVNSVHSDRYSDYYFPQAFGGREKSVTYKEYFSLVLNSVKAPYDYDIIGHISYCSRYAPYDDAKVRYSDFKEEIDSVLKEIVFRGKILEVNSSASGSGGNFLPDRDILERYYALGGTRVSYASDAHGKGRIMDKREEVVSALKEIGFEYITVPVCGKYVEVPV